MPEPRVKICGLTRVEDARRAEDAGADYLGAILSSGFGRSVAADIARAFGGPRRPPLVAVLVDESVDAAAQLARSAGAAVIQLHGDEPGSTLSSLRDEGDWRLWKAVRPRSADDLRRALEDYASRADALLVDGWHPELRGGAGARFPWDVLEAVRPEFPEGLELVVAGGLGPESVAEAVARLAPDVVDVSSGVESAPGRKDPVRVDAFVRAARAAAGPTGAPSSSFSREAR